MRVYDPKAMDKAKAVLPSATYVDNMDAVAKGCDALVIATEWDEFKKLDLEKSREVMSAPIMFDGRNPVNKYTFSDERDAEDWQTYQTKALKHPQVWATKGFEEMKSSINSVVVVDLPRDGESSLRPAPYWYFLMI